jgi:dTMP kinase
MFENLNDLMKVREKAMELAKDWHTINTGQSIELAQKDINNILEKLDKDASSKTI